MNPPDFSKLPTRFWDKVEIAPSGCWLWTAGTSTNGYGQYRHEGRTARAHRVAAVDAKGPIPEGKFALHTCDIPPCVRSAHLYLGTIQDNTDDMYRRGRNKPVRGEQNGNAKLTESDVRAIRRMYATGDIYLHDLAARFTVSVAAISMLISRTTWQHVV